MTPRKNRRRAALPCLAALALATPAPALAGWHLDLFAGHGWVEDSALHLRAAQPRLGPRAPGGVEVRARLDEVSTDGFATYGLRAGHWLDGLPWLGLALEAARFAPDVKAQRVRGEASATLGGEVFEAPLELAAGLAEGIALPRLRIPATVVAAATLRLRATLPAPVPGGVEAYAGAGPALLFTSSDPDADLGLTAHLGVAWQAVDWAAPFLEYRTLRVTAEEVAGSVRRGPLASGDIVARTRVRSHALVGGVSLRF